MVVSCRLLRNRTGNQQLQTSLSMPNLPCFTWDEKIVFIDSAFLFNAAIVSLPKRRNKSHGNAKRTGGAIFFQQKPALVPIAFGT